MTQSTNPDPMALAALTQRSEQTATQAEAMLPGGHDTSATQTGAALSSHAKMAERRCPGQREV